MKCKDCKHLGWDGEPPALRYCSVIEGRPDRDMERECYGFEPISNGDRMRCMADEELSKILLRGCPPDVVCIGGDCQMCWLEWLGAPVDGGEDG